MRKRGSPPCVFAVLLVLWVSGAALAENVDPGSDGSQYAWGENIGWLNAEPQGDGAMGVQVTDAELSGWIWAGDHGWISLSCQNTSSCGTNDYGVTNDGKGNLSGFAWGEHLGWINFRTSDGSDCCSASGTPGCTDSVCEAVICPANPSCCNDNWDLSCAGAALAEPACSPGCAAESFGVRIHGFTGEFSGFAWTEHHGRINFGTAPLAQSYQIETSWTCPDPDADGVCTASDGCPADANTDQADDDGDLFGSACDTCPAMPNGVAQQIAGAFGEETVTTLTSVAFAVFAADLDGDGDADVLSASVNDNKIAWYENCSLAPSAGCAGDFGPQQIITASAVFATSVFATDLDGDGDADVLSSSLNDDDVSWYENCSVDPPASCTAGFGPRQTISSSPAVDNAISVFATDLDGDGDADALSASVLDNKIAWYENLGGDFGDPATNQRIISTSAGQPSDVFAVDLDGDGDADVLYASQTGNKIAWHENCTTQSPGGCTNGFGAEQPVTAPGVISSGRAVYAADLDLDGDADVLSASLNDDKIAWYENQGNGTFGPQQVITTLANGADGVFATDLDLDGDADVLSTSVFDGKVAWYENVDGDFGNPATNQRIISTAVGEAHDVFATDLDGDGDADLVTALTTESRIAWYENFLPLAQEDSDGDGAGNVCDPCMTYDASGRFGQSLSAANNTDLVWSVATDWELATGTFATSSDIGTYVVDFFANGSGTFVTNSGFPGAGSGYWYILRPDCPIGSYSTGSPSEQGDRDGSLFP